MTVDELITFLNDCDSDLAVRTVECGDNPLDYSDCFDIEDIIILSKTHSGIDDGVYLIVNREA